MKETKTLFKEARKKSQLLIQDKFVEDPHRAHRTHEFKMGFDSVIQGPNSTNSNFRIFQRPEMTKEWEQGAKFAKQILEDIKE